MQMKLYSEEQVKKAIEMARECDSDCFVLDFNNGTTDEIVGELTPIELPSDEEINKEVSLLGTMFDIGFIEGAKWVIEQIKQHCNGK